MSRRPRISPLLPYTTLCRSYIKGGAVLVHEVVDAWRLGDPFGEVLLLRFDTPRATAPEHRRFSHALYPGRAQQPEEFQEHPGRRRRIREGPVVRHLPHRSEERRVGK